ncbi:Similar to hypothetical protein [Tuber melanosporum Mel28]; acc. no. XP_002836798 [Pyronema omphalodes CBS 100304]|uniref:CENP-V/GFA domain-containing protein n=1 Tax=Pyronema omphalodes (strain CBS 100304) TaxID=1076935 RepID=U4KW37_PYROM|nr:Similar to hypothetical protein [Tuber melanosporum Mel28]; acc. no. XP_002836798 [Pyronema omphalodes CBS 100304]
MSSPTIPAWKPPLTIRCHCQKSTCNISRPRWDPEGTNLPEANPRNSVFDVIEGVFKSGEETIRFCTTCGTRMLLITSGEKVKVFIGCFDNHDVQSARNHNLVIESFPEKPALLREPSNDVITGRCLCRSVIFTIHKPPEDWHKDAVLRQWVKSTTGAPYWQWAFIPRSLVTDIPFERLQKYKSSDTVTRYFCKKCGETYFYENAGNGGDELWDVAYDTLAFEADTIAKQWFQSAFRDEDWDDNQKVDEYIEGWIEGRFSFDSEGVSFLGHEKH